jgi:hypothetical protein
VPVVQTLIPSRQLCCSTLVSSRYKKEPESMNDTNLSDDAIIRSMRKPDNFEKPTHLSMVRPLAASSF